MNCMMSAMALGWLWSISASDSGRLRLDRMLRYVRHSVRMCLMVIWMPHVGHVEGSSLAIRKLCEICEWPILSLVMITSNFLGVSMGNVQSVLCFIWFSLVNKDNHFWCHLRWHLLVISALMSLYDMIFVGDDSEEVIAVLAARSARSFSMMLECPGIQKSLILKLLIFLSVYILFWI